MTITEAKQMNGRYAWCFRITRAKSGVGYDIKPFSVDPITEPTTFAVCLEFQGEDDDTLRLEVNCHNEGFRNHADRKTHMDGACTWLMTLWQEWLQGHNVEPWIARQFEAIRQESQRILRKIYGKTNFTEREFEIAAEEWHEGVRRAEFWNRILPGKPVPPSGLVGSFGMGGREGEL
jgi:hypothetical protein